MVIQLTRDLVGALKNNPLALTLLLINVLYLVGGFVWLREERARDLQVATQLLDRCR